MEKTAKAEIFATLKSEILRLQGNRPQCLSVPHCLGIIEHSFPERSFPKAAIHEFHSLCPEDFAATTGFISGLLGKILNKSAVILWINSGNGFFAHGLTCFGLSPDNVIVVEMKNRKESLAVMEEALKCPALSAVVAETDSLSFTASRRLQLAIEESGAMGIVLTSRELKQSTVSAARWKIKPSPSIPVDNLPGTGFPAWNVELLKVKNGKPGTWRVSWMKGDFIVDSSAIIANRTPVELKAG